MTQAAVLPDDILAGDPSTLAAWVKFLPARLTKGSWQFKSGPLIAHEAEKTRKKQPFE
jgi:hypothetical protein